MTDPEYPTGWTGTDPVTSQTEEMGDKCAYNYNGAGEGSTTGLSNNGSGDYNQTINGHDYLMQTEFANALSNGSTTGCVANTPPIAIIVPPGPIQAGVPVSFNGSSSTDGSAPTTLTYAWNFGDGSTGSGATPSHTYTAPGSYTVKLQVTDGNNFVDTQTVAVTVHGPPTASFTEPSSGVAGAPVGFDGTASSEAFGSIAGYTWNFGDGSTGSGATPSHTYAAAGAYTVSLTVTDGGGSVSQPVTQTITISQPQPTLRISPAASILVATAHPTKGLPVAFHGTGQDRNAGGSITGYAWKYGDGATGSGAAATHTYAAAGKYAVSLTVTDHEGDTTTVTASVTVLSPSTITKVTSRNNGRVIAISVNGPGTISVGRARVTLRSAGTARLRITLSKRQRRSLAQGHKLKIRYAIAFVPLAGPPVTVHALVVIRK
jgi:PKD repeat protein